LIGIGEFSLFSVIYRELISGVGTTTIISDISISQGTNASRSNLTIDIQAHHAVPEKAMDQARSPVSPHSNTYAISA
jgi:hypothetical protein